MAELKYINEYYSVFGGLSALKKVGNRVRALINHTFDDSLIWSIVEMVNLNHPSLFGEGTTYIYSHLDSDAANLKLLESYDQLIKDIKSKDIPIAAYKKWYDLHSFLYIDESLAATVTGSEMSTWRLDEILPSRPLDEEERQEFAYIDSPELTEKDMVSKASEYLKEYIGRFKETFSMDQFPHHAIIVRPISVRHFGTTVPAGNVYMHFATRDKKDEVFYSNFINNFLFVWHNEKGSAINKSIQEEAIKVVEAKQFNRIEDNYPAIYKKGHKIKISSTETDKFEQTFSKSNVTRKAFFDTFFGSDVYMQALEDCKNIILSDLLPSLLKMKGWLKGNVKALSVREVLDKLKPKAQHNTLKGLEEKSLCDFGRIIVGRYFINVCSCLFGYSMPQIHTMMTNRNIDSYDNLDKKKVADTISPYLTQYFIYCINQRDWTEMIAADILEQAALKEEAFLISCAQQIELLIKMEAIAEFNAHCCSSLALNAPALQIHKGNQIAKTKIFDFKRNWCDENGHISRILSTQAAKYLVPPILDCGAGLGDIAFNSFPDKEATLIDVNEIIDPSTKISANHTHKVIDFFEYVPPKPIKTLLISHTLQFIDDDTPILNETISKLNPKYVILVLNKNNDIMGELLEWTTNNTEFSNPEKKLLEFPLGYRLAESFPFTAEVSCRDFDSLAEQISYLMLFDLSRVKDELKLFLSERLGEFPKFEFDQVIEVYERDA